MESSNTPEIEALLAQAEKYRLLGQHAESLRTAKKSLLSARRKHGRRVDHSDISDSLYYLGAASWSLNVLPKAIFFLEASLVMDRRQFSGENRQELAQGLNALAICKNKMGDFATAFQCYEEATYIVDRVLAETPPDQHAPLIRTRLSLFHGMGNNAFSLGKYRQALEHYRRALELCTGDDDDDKTTENAGIANTFHAIGDSAEALTWYRSAMMCARRHLEKNAARVDNNFANLLHNYANALLKTGNITEAQQFYEESLTIKRSLAGANAAETIDVASSLHGLASTWKKAGNLPMALGLAQQALAMRRKVLGAGVARPDVARDLHLLGEILEADSDYSGAVEIYEEAIALYQRHAREQNLIQEHDLDHPNTAATWHALARASAFQGEYERAWESEKAAVNMANRLFHKHYTFLDPATLEREMRIGHLTYLTLHHFPEDSARVQELFESVSQFKAIETETRAEMRATVWNNRYPEHGERITRWDEINTEIAFRTWKYPGDYQDILEALVTERRELERSLFQVIPELREEWIPPQVKAESIATHLPEKAALVEYLKFHAIPATGATNTKEIFHYAAFILSNPQIAGVPLIELVGLEDSVPIDRCIALLRDGGDGVSPTEQLENLYTSLWHPIEPALGKAKRILIAPDGQINFVPFEALIPGSAQGHLVDHGYHVTYLASGRDLTIFRAPVSPASLDTESGTPFVLGDPDYNLRNVAFVPLPVEQKGDNAGEVTGTDGNDRGDNRRGVARRRSRGALPRLPFAALEARRVAKRLGVSPLLGEEALVGRVRRVPAPRVLHLATHAIYLSEELVSTLQPKSSVVHERLATIKRYASPFTLGAIFFAGANTFLKGEPCLPWVGTGVLTGEEIATWDLRATQLAIISACDGAIGSPETSRGVMGLRAAFREAGCRRFITSLWEVEDIPTAILMDRFYHYWSKPPVSFPAPVDDALRQAQEYIRTVTCRELVDDWCSDTTVAAIQQMRDTTTDPEARTDIEYCLEDLHRIRNAKPNSHPYQHPMHWAAFICQGDPSPLAW